MIISTEAEKKFDKTKYPLMVKNAQVGIEQKYPKEIKAI